ncbi:DeoR/GlpR family DNA-binding transcription regulator [Anaerorhabdus sp.]|uniref:DeoR/GlpR family DNA-binding transcription regulator n=1 Tax=Anaerorhabdus sp. TaxID=1872524 RepID=UPI002FCC028A
MKITRLQKLEDYIKLIGTVSNEELCNEFNISLQTLRRDLKILEDNDRIDKVYGGVVYKDKSLLNSVQAIENREMLNLKEKKYVAQIAARLVENNSVIFIDSGTTACQIVPYLNHHKNVTVITHSLLVVNMVAKLQNLKCICLGGLLKADTLSFAIDITDNSYHCNIAFIATVGLSNEGLTNTDIEEGKIKEHMIQCSEKVYILADHSKLLNKGFYHFADLENISGVVLDQKPNDKFINQCNKVGVNLFYE